MEELKFCKIRKVKSIEKAHDLDAGFDFFVPEDFETVILEPHKDVLIPSGIKVDVPKGYALIGFNKSGVATKYKLRLGACVIDCGYQGEVLINMMNSGTEKVAIIPNMKIAQFILVKIGNHTATEITPAEYEEIVKSTRGAGGFGSTGI